MKEQIEAYLESKALAWAPSTLKSERARLQANVEGMKDGPQAHFLELTKSQHPYTIKTCFIRLANFERFSSGTSTYADFIKTNGRLFKHVYEKEKIKIDFEEAKKRVLAIKDPAIKAKAIQLLSSGSRWTESFTLDSDGMVTGKGRKRRKLHNVAPMAFPYSYSTFLRQLYKETGLKPHSLRKLFATQAVELGFTMADLMEVMGWSTAETANSYLQAKREDELARRLQKLVG